MQLSATPHVFATASQLCFEERQPRMSLGSVITHASANAYTHCTSLSACA